MTTLYHCCVDLGAIIKGREDCIGVVRHFDACMREAPTEHIIAQAVIKRAQGMEAWPLCDSHTAKGQCKGHPK